MQEKMNLFANADALKEPGQTLEDNCFRHVKSILERRSWEITPHKWVGWCMMTYIAEFLARNKVDSFEITFFQLKSLVSTPSFSYLLQFTK